MESQDQAMAPTLQTRRARREAALAALESSPVTMSVPGSSVPGAVRTPAPHAAPSRPDGTFPPALDAHREPPVSPLRTTWRVIFTGLLAGFFRLTCWTGGVATFLATVFPGFLTSVFREIAVVSPDAGTCRRVPATSFSFFSRLTRLNSAVVVP